MKYLYIKDKKKRSLLQKFELKRLILKSLIYNLNLKYNIREKIYIKLKILVNNNNGLYTVVRNRCVYTNRARFLILKYKLSRHSFKLLNVEGKLVGVYKKN